MAEGTAEPDLDDSETVKEDSTVAANELADSSAATSEEKEVLDAAEAEAAFMRQCKDVYQMFDRGIGHLLTKDLGMALRTLGQIPSEHEIDAMVSKLEQEDLYSRGHTKLSFDDFYRIVQENSERKTDIREMVLDSFRSIDPMNTGLVSAAKLTSLLTSLGEVLSAAEVRELLQDAEVDKDGCVNYVKFVENVLAFDVTSAADTKGDQAAVKPADSVSGINQQQPT